MDPITRQAIAVAGGAGGGGATYVDDVFSTFLYDGTGSGASPAVGQTINNGIDLSGEGGLVWFKNRDTTYPHRIYDTERGVNEFLESNSTAAEVNATHGLTAFNSNGFTIGTMPQLNEGTSGYEEHVSWTFRKAPGFFDVVTYTGNGTNQSIAHNLGSVPGCIMIKNLSSTAHWVVYHRGTSVPAEKALVLNENWAEDDDVYFNDTAPTSTHFTVGPKTQTNANNETYVAYIFAHDDQSFGTDSDESIIKCDSFTVNSSGEATVNLGFEPQLVITKNASGSGAWFIFDSMRGMAAGGNDAYLRPDTNGQESGGSNFIEPTANGFEIKNLGSNTTFVYMAIRRPHKPPTAGTEVFQNLNYNGTSATVTRSTNILVDALITQRTNAGTPYFLDRVRGFSKYMQPDNVYTEGTQTTNITTAANNFLEMGSGATVNYSGKNYLLSMFKRAPGFFDVVTYKGSGTSQAISHNLKAVPELIIVKVRDTSDDWPVYNAPNTASDYINLNSNSSTTSNSTRWNNTSPTSTVFTVGTDGSVNNSIRKYVAYLFATLDGISKVGAYSGTGYDINVDCGFTNGARWIMIKRTNGTGDWYIFNTLRGINSGNDPYMVLNSNAAEVTNTDYIDPLNAGFTVTSSAPSALNASGGYYLFLAIA